MCGHFTGGNFRAFCDVAKSYLRGNEIYGFVHH
jgi:chitinase